MVVLPLQRRSSQRMGKNKKSLGSLFQELKKTIPSHEAEQIVSFAYQKFFQQKLTRMELYAKCKKFLSDRAVQFILENVRKRAKGIPLQYITGAQTFLDHEYEVNPFVLIPRPETEVLVDRAIREIKEWKKTKLLGFEVGIGSGVISIELLTAFPCLKMQATEVSSGGVLIAQKNARKILGKNCNRLQIIKTQANTGILNPFQKKQGYPKADFLISNPPYLSPGDEIQDEVSEHEPKRALFPASGDPLQFYQETAVGAFKVLKKEGVLFLEIPHERAFKIKKLFLDQIGRAHV